MRPGRGLPPWLVLPSLVVGGVVAACGIGMLISAVIGFVSDGREILAVAVPGAAALLVGASTMRVAAGRATPQLTIRPTSGFAAVTLAWVAAAAVGCVPLLVAGTLSSPLDAYFEAMSGFTTTGATLIADIEAQPDGVLMWRSMTQWMGGIGIVVLVVSIAPVSGPALQRAFYAEVSGVTAERLTPRIVDTAKIIAGIYLALSAAAAAAYLIAGMGLFDAVAHMFTTLATGGFSPRNDSIASFDSLAIELVAIVFMALAAINFAFYWRAIRGGPLRPQFAEVRAFLVILLVAIAAVAASLLIADNVTGVFEAIRQAAFSVTSITTTTGYTTADFDTWNEFARLGLLVLMFVGGCAGSTAGGMKVIRVILLGRIAEQEVTRQLQPSSVQVLRLGGRPFPELLRAAVLSFALIYALVFLVGSFALAMTGVDLATAISGTSATLNVIGPGLGDVGAVDNFTAIPAGGRAIGLVLMLIGRLEVFTVVALLAALFRLGRR
jgi:trk system potassium uptake protein TrkH